jgi:hypothetical protein
MRLRRLVDSPDGDKARLAPAKVQLQPREARIVERLVSQQRGPRDFFSARIGCPVYQPVYGMDLGTLCIGD